MLTAPPKLYSPNEFDQHFDPKAYLEKYYGPNRPDEFEKESLPFIIKTVYEILKNLKSAAGTTAAESTDAGSVRAPRRLLEIGSGSSLMLPILANEFFDEIFLADNSEKGRNEATNWLNYGSDAFDWKPFIDYLKEKNVPLGENILENVREKIKDVINCDVMTDSVLINSSVCDGRKMDAVATVFYLESVAESYDQYKQAVKNVSALIETGGAFLQAGMLNQSYFDAGSCYFTTLATSKMQVLDALDEAKIDVEAWNDFEVPYCDATRTTTSPGASMYICVGVKRE